MAQTLEQFAIINGIVNGVVAADSLYCAIEGESERCNDEKYMDAIADGLNKKLSQNQLENTINVLSHALSRRIYPGVQPVF